MNIQLYDLTTPTFSALLAQLAFLLDKAEDHAKQVGYDSKLLVSARLAADMYPLSSQVQIACDTAKFCITRLSGAEAPKIADTESTMAELKARIAATIEFIQSVPADKINAGKDKPVEWKTRGGMKSAPALTYINRWALPNFYFHLTTAYNILRHNGVVLGKPDFLGSL